MGGKITRRALAGLVTAAASAPGQNPPAPAGQENHLEDARARLKSNAEQIAKVPLDMSVEPAIHFKA
jgi:hypothetical protein